MAGSPLTTMATGLVGEVGVEAVGRSTPDGAAPLLSAGTLRGNDRGAQATVAAAGDASDLGASSCTV